MLLSGFAKQNEGATVAARIRGVGKKPPRNCRLSFRIALTGGFLNACEGGDRLFSA